MNVAEWTESHNFVILTRLFFTVVFPTDNTARKTDLTDCIFICNWWNYHVFDDTRNLDHLWLDRHQILASDIAIMKIFVKNTEKITLKAKMCTTGKINDERGVGSWWGSVGLKVIFDLDHKGLV